ncbi:GNAT family protein [Exidia glandulosa HHB12029]|uniref:GNAT family protein n=1 Tax=Exidia glandulosa HHB12029 TaxID=1314781 RepID=A0A165HTA1_EXIGL|nr:GNAT family protein [Exidia glandulosa HHB12029]
MTTTFRTASLEDIDAIVALVTSAYRGESSRAGWTTEADLIEGIRITPDMVSRERSRIILLERDGQLVACGHVTEEDGAGYLGMFSVQPGLQGGGIGKLVLAEAERIVRVELGLMTMRMTVLDVREELLQFYERRGYARTGKFKPFPYGDERHGVPLRDDLQFVVMEKSLL